MSRVITVAAAQLGPIQKSEARTIAVERMVRLMERAHARGDVLGDAASEPDSIWRALRSWAPL